MIDLFYWPLTVWLPLIFFQCLAAMYLSRGAQTAVLQLTKLLIDTALIGYVLKILWVIMLVICLDCLRNIFSASTSQMSAGSNFDTRAFELYAAKEGALVMSLNLIAMLFVQALHSLQKECLKLETDRDAMKRQAQGAAQLTNQLLADGTKKATDGSPPSSAMPEAKNKSS